MRKLKNLFHLILMWLIIFYWIAGVFSVGYNFIEIVEFSWWDWSLYWFWITFASGFIFVEISE